MSADSRGDLRLLAIVLGVVALLGLLVIAVLLPATAPAVRALNAGMGLRDSVPWGFGVTVGLFVLFAVVAGDGLIGELQFMLASFFGFFLVLTALIAWVF